MAMAAVDLEVSGCRERQRRLADEMMRLSLDLVIVTRREMIQWLTGVYYKPLFEPVAALDANGHCILVAPNREPERSAADTVVTYEAQWTSTLRNDQPAAAAAALRDALASRPAPRKLGVEYSRFGPHFALMFADAETIDIEPALYYLRRHKEPDELRLLQAAIDATGKMYERAREIVEPGVSELHVFNELQAAAVEHLGEMLTGTGNDYQSGARGGPPRARNAEAGELYILDLGPAYRGYFADNCRTLSVGRSPTDEQLAAWQQVVRVFDLVERRVKPGYSCKALYEEAKQMLDEYMPGSFNHHLGHGIGLNPHEAPHVNPRWDDAFEEGDVFTIEPGLYAPELRAGLRLENDYLVTHDGVKLLSDFPLPYVL